MQGCPLLPQISLPTFVRIRFQEASGVSVSVEPAVSLPVASCRQVNVETCVQHGGASIHGCHEATGGRCLQGGGASSPCPCTPRRTPTGGCGRSNTLPSTCTAPPSSGVPWRPPTPVRRPPFPPAPPGAERAITTLCHHTFFPFEIAALLRALKSCHRLHHVSRLCGTTYHMSDCSKHNAHVGLINSTLRYMKHSACTRTSQHQAADLADAIKRCPSVTKRCGRGAG